jgi:hypothetical protein
MSKLRARAATLLSNLFRVGDRQPLAKPALVVLLFLDAFVLVSIFEGLAEHTGQLATPFARVPHVCVEMVIERRWGEADRLDRLRQAIPFDRSPYPGAPAVEVHPLCAPLLDGLRAVGEDAEVASALRARGDVTAELGRLEGAMASLRPAYDTALLETAAGRPGPAIPAIEAELRQKTAALDGLRAHLATIDAALLGAPAVAALFAQLSGLGDRDRLRLESDLRRLTFWFPLKRLGMELLFLVPLLGLFLGWTVRSARRGPGVQTLVASHLLVVACVPVFLKVIEAVYEVIPKRLLAAVIALLARLNLVALWHYLVIALGIAVALGLIYLVQRRLFSPGRLAQRRIARGQCQDCGGRLPPSARACPSCGFAQFRRCPACSGSAHVRAAHCAECGADLRAGEAPATGPGALEPGAT